MKWFQESSALTAYPPAGHLALYGIALLSVSAQKKAGVLQSVVVSRAVSKITSKTKSEPGQVVKDEKVLTSRMVFPTTTISVIATK